MALLAACGSPSRSQRDALADWERSTQAPAVASDDRAPLVEPGTDSTLPELQRWAAEHDPALRAAAMRWKAALERVPQADALPDPRLSFGYFLEEVQTRTGPMQWRLGLSQPLPWWGELDRAGEAALAAAAAEGERFRGALLMQRARVVDAWAELAWLDEAERVTAGHGELVGNWEEVARARYATGLAPEADVIRAQVEMGKLDDRLRTLRDLHHPVAARLNALLDRPSDAPLPTPGLDELPGHPFDEEALTAALADGNPELAALAHAVSAAEARRELAGFAGWPDASLGAEWTRIGKGGDDALALTAGLSIPLQRGRVRAAVAEADAALSAARAELAAARRRLEADVQFQLYHLRDAERRVALYRDTLLPKGQESVAAINVAYQAGQAGFLDLIDAERVLLEFELAVARASTDRAQAQAALDALVGAAIPAETGP